MKSIETKYHGPSNVRGSRIIASDSDNNRIIHSYDHSLNSEQNHMAAAKTLCTKMKWYGSLWGGHTKSGMVFVWTDTELSFTVVPPQSEAK